MRVMRVYILAMNWVIMMIKMRTFLITLIDPDTDIRFKSMQKYSDDILSTKDDPLAYIKSVAGNQIDPMSGMPRKYMVVDVSENNKFERKSEGIYYSPYRTVTRVHVFKKLVKRKFRKGKNRRVW